MIFSKLLRRRASRLRPARRKAGRRLRLESLERREVLSAVAWELGPELPSARAEAKAVVAPDDSILLLGGGTAAVAQLAATGEDWTTGHPLDKPLFGPGAATTTDGKVFVFAGLDVDESTDEAWVYDLAMGDHQNIEQLNTPRAEFGSTADEYNHAYAIGGIDSDENVVLRSVEQYDPSTDQWQEVAELPTPTHSAAVAADNSGHLYVFGGSATSAAGGILDTSYRYTISANSWEPIASLPLAVEDGAAVFAGDGNLYLLGGNSSAGATSAVQVYDPSADAWTANTNLPVALHSHAAVVDSTGHIVVVGGYGAAGSPVSTVYQSQRLDIPDAPPMFSSEPVTLGSLDSPYSYDVGATGNPEPTYALVAAPDGMQINANSGLITWQPVIGQHGTQEVVVRATNQAGFTDQAFVIDIPVSAPSFTSTPVTTGSLDEAYAYTASAAGSPTAAFSIISGPAGMTIDAVTGLASWQPVEGQQGLQTVVIRAENFVGFADQTFTIDVAYDTIAPEAPTSLTFDGATTTTIDLSWQAANDNRGIAYYEVLKGYRTGWRGKKTAYRVIKTGIPGTSTTLTDLAPLSFHKLVVRAVDGGGNVSPSSNQVVAQTQAPPTLRYYVDGRINGQATITANHLLGIQLSASANPAPSFGLVSGPAGMTVDPVSGLLQWTPTAGDVGTVTATVEASNSVGAAQIEIPITVEADLPVLSPRFNPNSTGSRIVVAGQPLEIQVIDQSHTPTTLFELQSAPTGMTIDPATGWIQWAPTAADAGPTSVTVVGHNSAGSTQLPISFETFFTDKPFDLQATGEDLLYPTISWAAPVGEGADLITDYVVTASTRYRYGRSYRTHRVVVDVPDAATSTEIVGLRAGKEYKITVNALDAAGNRGALSTEPATVRSVPAIPRVSWTITNPAGGPIVANQPLEIQLNNQSPEPATFELIDGPAGMTLDSVTGLATWTPGVDDIGSQTIHFRATNQIGPRDVAVRLNVLFSGPVENATAIRNANNSATVSWDAPTDNVVPVASYQITMHWRWSSRRRTRSVTVPADQLSVTLGLIPTGAVWHQGVTITPIDELGRAGASTPRVDYAP